MTDRPNTIDLKPVIRAFFYLLFSIRKLLALIGAVFAACAFCLWCFDSKCLFDSVYLAFTTFLTIGSYGDLTPVSTVARIVCVLLGFDGFAFMGIVVTATIKAIEQS